MEEAKKLESNWVFAISPEYLVHGFHKARERKQDQNLQALL